MSETEQSLEILCRRLRSKGMFLEVEPDPTVPSMNDGATWCSRTMTCLGPDGEAVSKKSCRSGRSCFETF